MRSSPSVRRAVAVRPKTNLHAERDRLLIRPCGELAAGHAGREAEVVAHHRARAGLAADGGRLDDGDAQPLGRPVHRRGEARRAGADHRDVDTLGADGGLDAERGSDLCLPGSCQGAPVGQDHDRQRPLDPRGLEQRPALGGSGIAERERQEEPRERIPHGACGCLPRFADDGQRHAGAIVLVRPARQRGRHDGVELLIGRAERSRDPGVDLADGESPGRSRRSC